MKRPPKLSVAAGYGQRKDWVRVNAALSPHLHQRLTRVAKLTGWSLRDTIAVAVQMWCDRIERP